MSEIFIQFKKLNWLLVFLISFLSFVGLVMIYSVTYGGDDRIFTSHLSKICLGLFIMIGVSLVDLNFIKKHAYLFYLIGIILLICATFFGIVGKGSRRWLNIGGLVFQPSELIHCHHSNNGANHLQYAYLEIAHQVFLDEALSVLPHLE